MMTNRCSVTRVISVVALDWASDSYNFDLRGSATYAAGAITGTWSESIRNAAGTLAPRSLCAS